MDTIIFIRVHGEIILVWGDNWILLWVIFIRVHGVIPLFLVDNWMFIDSFICVLGAITLFAVDKCQLMIRAFVCLVQ